MVQDKAVLTITDQ